MMALSGLSGGPLRCNLHQSTSGPGSHDQKVSLFSSFGRSTYLPSVQRSNWAASTQRFTLRSMSLVKCATDASYGDATNDSTGIFPRIHVKDPYKRLGISHEASEDEIQAARNFLIQRYAGHKSSVDAIESAHDKIIMQKFYERKNPKINIKKKVLEVTQSKYVQAVTSRRRANPSGCNFSNHYHVLNVPEAEEQTPSFPFWGWNICPLMAFGNIPNGVCDPTYTKRAKKFGSVNFSDNLCLPLGFFYLP